MDESGTVPKYIWSYFYTQVGLMMSNARTAASASSRCFRGFIPMPGAQKSPGEPLPGGLLSAPADSCMEFGKN